MLEKDEELAIHIGHVRSILSKPYFRLLLVEAMS